MQELQVKLAVAEKQAIIENKQADTANKQAQAVNKFSETEQNDVENAVQMAELAAAAGDQDLLNQALATVTALVRNTGSQGQQTF